MAGAEVKRALHTIRPAAVDRNALCKMNAQLVPVSTRGWFKLSQVAEAKGRETELRGRRVRCGPLLRRADTAVVCWVLSALCE